MRKKLALSLLIALPFFWASCETDFSLNGEYEITPVVFGLLDHKADVHIIKITKAYLGDGDNLEYAKIPDSSYFNTVDAKVIEYKNNVKTGREWQLHDSLVTEKSTSGIFYGPEQKVYVFYANDLDSSAEYELVADLNEGQHSINSKTTLIPGFYVSNSVLLNPQIPFAGNSTNPADLYKNWTFSVYEGKNAKNYNYKYTIRWTEFYADNSTQSFSATRNNGDKPQANPNSPGIQSAVFSGLDFFQWVGEAVPDDANVVRRRLDGLDIRISVAHKELDQFMALSKPVSGIAQIQPEYTNINGGYGLFSSRIVYDIKNFRLNAASRKELSTGTYTGVKLFCSQYIEDQSETFYCP